MTAKHIDEGSPFHELSQFVLPLYATTKAGYAKCLGTCVVIATAKTSAIALTAVHVIKAAERLGKMVRVNESLIPRDFRKPELDEVFPAAMPPGDYPLENTIFTVLGGFNAIAVMERVSYYPGRQYDVAAMCLTFIQGNSLPRFPMQCAVQSLGPFAGDEVMLCGYPEGNEIEFFEDQPGLTATIKISKKIGRVINRFDWDESSLVKSPGFSIESGAPSGFSGGAVLSNPVGSPLTLCGIVSSSDAQTTDAAILYPALGLNNTIDHSNDVPDNLLGLTGLPGALKDLDQALEHVVLRHDADVKHLRDHVRWS